MKCGSMWMLHMLVVLVYVQSTAITLMVLKRQTHLTQMHINGFSRTFDCSVLWIKVTIEVLYVFAQPVIYSVLVYAMIGFEWTVAKFFWYLFFMFFTCLCFTFYGMTGVALTPNQHVAGITSNAFYALWNLFSGFIIPLTLLSENSYMAEMVLLGIPNGLDLVWIDCITVWRYRGQAQHRQQ